MILIPVFSTGFYYIQLLSGFYRTAVFFWILIGLTWIGGVVSLLKDHIKLGMRSLMRMGSLMSLRSLIRMRSSFRAGIRKQSQRKTKRKPRNGKIQTTLQTTIVANMANVENCCSMEHIFDYSQKVKIFPKLRCQTGYTSRDHRKTGRRRRTENDFISVRSIILKKYCHFA